MFKNKKVLVTGGTGLVGRELVELLVNRGADVTSVSLDENNLDPEWGAKYVKLDLRSRENCFKICHGMDYVFHIAGIKGSPVVMKKFQYQIFRDFIMLNTNMIDAIYSTPTVKWGLYTSTIGTYGPARTFKEDDLWTQNPSPNDWYAGWSKRMGEVQINAYDEQYGQPKMSIIKPANIYGKFDNFDLRTSTLIPSLTRKVSEATDSVEIWGTGTAGRDIIHARDVAGAAIFAVENKISEPMNVGNGRTFTIKETIEALIKVSGKDLAITHDLTKPTGDQFRVPVTDRLNGYGFYPSLTLEEGLKDTYEWYEQNGPTTGRFNPYHLGENNDK
jgi:GDP-L-fucose synthase